MERLLLSGLRPALFLPDVQRAEAFYDFFPIRAKTRGAPITASPVCFAFSLWCEGRGLYSLGHVKPVHVAVYIEG
jgi:hypothetical protein